MLEDVGGRRVRYGQLRDAPLGQMGLAEPERVKQPVKMKGGGGPHVNRRIGIGAVIGAVVAVTVGVGMGRLDV